MTKKLQCLAIFSESNASHRITWIQRWRSGQSYSVTSAPNYSRLVSFVYSALLSLSSSPFLTCSCPSLFQLWFPPLAALVKLFKTGKSSRYVHQWCLQHLHTLHFYDESQWCLFFPYALGKTRINISCGSHALTFGPLVILSHFSVHWSDNAQIKPKFQFIFPIHVEAYLTIKIQILL